MQEQTNKHIQSMIDHLFRENSGQMVATLCRVLGAKNIDLAENCVSESMLKAIQAWPKSGVPENPKAWLYRVAKNHAIDSLRRSSNFQDKIEFIKHEFDDTYELDDEDPYIRPILNDDRIKLIFLCCHPILNPKEQIAMSLKLGMGLNVQEISRSFLIPIKTLEQRLVRAKKKLRENNIVLELPEKSQVLKRLDSLLKTLYLVFNEGHSSSNGDNLITKDLCLDAIYILESILTVPDFKTPKAQALLALFYLQASRLDTRTDEQGKIVLLKNQNRARWNHLFIQKGLSFLENSFDTDQLSQFHIEAKIAAFHAISPNYENTDWNSIIDQYEILSNHSRNPLYKLNQAVAMMESGKPEKALQVLDSIKKEKSLTSYHLYYCALGEAYSQTHQAGLSKTAFTKALSLAKTKPEQDFIREKLLI